METSATKLSRAMSCTVGAGSERSRSNCPKCRPRSAGSLTPTAFCLISSSTSAPLQTYRRAEIRTQSRKCSAHNGRHFRRLTVQVFWFFRVFEYRAERLVRFIREPAPRRRFNSAFPDRHCDILYMTGRRLTRWHMKCFCARPMLSSRTCLCPGCSYSGQLMSRFFIVTLSECRSVTPAHRKLSAPERMPYPPQTPMLGIPTLRGIAHAARGTGGLCVKTRMA